MRPLAISVRYVASRPAQCSRTAFTRLRAQTLSPSTRPFSSASSLSQQIAWSPRKDTTPVQDTIYALSTGTGRAAIAVIRISGPACLDIYGGLCPNRPFPPSRVATLRKLYDPRPTSDSKPVVLDSGALVLYFPSPTTVTGEDVLEFHVHGGPAIVRSILEAIPRCTDSRSRKQSVEYSFIRPAEAGEFTKRAFYNGRLDLTQAEALGDILAAETEQQRRLAVSGSENTLAKRYEAWQKMLLYARGEMEALIDFSEDQHFDESPVELVASVSAQVLALKWQIDIHLQNALKGELLRSGISIALLGAPNTGKSSLLNRLVGREAAIVSAEEGTTRDIVDVSVDIAGWLCRLGDMAGLREQNGALSGKDTHIGIVETEGIRRARARALESDVAIVLLSFETDGGGTPELVVNSQVLEAVKECVEAGKEILVAINKADLLPAGTSATPFISQLKTILPTVPQNRIFTISCKDASTSAIDTAASSQPDPGNIQTFLKGLASVFEEMTTAVSTLESESAHSVSIPGIPPSQAQSYWSASLSISHRQSNYLRRCCEHLNAFLSRASPSSVTATPPTHPEADDLVGEVDIVALAEDLRFAADCLAKITGRGEGGDVEDVLGVVFEKFCVGK